MDSVLVLSFVASVIMFTFSGLVLYRYWQRHHLHDLFWGVGLLMFGLGTFAEAYLTLAWNDLLFRSWYVFGAMLNAAWLGHGSLLLLARRPWLRYVTLVLIVLSVIGVVATFATPIHADVFTVTLSVSEQYKAILPRGGVRLFTPFFNIYGTVFLVGGAVYSAVLLWRKQTSPQRLVGNALIAAGAVMIASAGTLTRLVFGGLMPVSELAAAVLMFSGFMVMSAPAPATVQTGEHAVGAG